MDSRAGHRQIFEFLGILRSGKNIYDRIDESPVWWKTILLGLSKAFIAITMAIDENSTWALSFVGYGYFVTVPWQIMWLLRTNCAPKRQGMQKSQPDRCRPQTLNRYPSTRIHHLLWPLYRNRRGQLTGSFVSSASDTHSSVLGNILHLLSYPCERAEVDIGISYHRMTEI